MSSDVSPTPLAMPPAWLIERLAAIQASIDTHAHAPVTLVAATKSADTALMQMLYQAGVRHFGENRLQEAMSKQHALSEASLHWHFIGSLQSNKALKAIDANFTLIHAVDSLALASRLSRLAAAQSRPQAVLMQVNISGESSKHGLSIHTLEAAFQQLVSLPGLNIQGLMTMAPAQAHSEERLAIFSALRALRDRLQTQNEHSLPTLSMGMSNDYLEALQAGSTMIRLGRALLTPPH
ncbi:MAG: YggS family pyridoxal phosphate-dependent enzyme [Vampirovibrionales bacterium]|nr:YggS family pyridoxal phosphate-dependent enzyme [Vampirovibrionales bacterium]